MTSYGYDPVSQLTSLSSATGATPIVSFGFTYNKAGQIDTRTTSNDAYAWTGHGSGSTTMTANGLNQINPSPSGGFVYDAKGNLTSDGTNSYVYDSENKLVSATDPGGYSTGATFRYDPLGRLQQAATAYSGYWAELVEDEAGQVVMEYGTLGRTRKYVFGPGSDEVLVQYFANATSSARTWYLQDERNSVVGNGDDLGSYGALRYGDYGEPQSTNFGRFQYTGQYWIVEPNILYYKNRFYDPKLGRFLQTDPIGYRAGMNLYGYVRGDPVNLRDPRGLEECPRDQCAPPIVIDANIYFLPNGAALLGGHGGGGAGSGGPYGSDGGAPGETTVPIVDLPPGQKPPPPPPLPPTPPPRRVCAAADAVDATGEIEQVVGSGAVVGGLLSGPGEVIIGGVGVVVIGVATIGRGAARFTKWMAGC